MWKKRANVKSASNGRVCVTSTKGRSPTAVLLSKCNECCPFEPRSAYQQNPWVVKENAIQLLRGTPHKAADNKCKSPPPLRRSSEPDMTRCSVLSHSGGCRTARRSVTHLSSTGRQLEPMLSVIISAHQTNSRNVRPPASLSVPTIDFCAPKKEERKTRSTGNSPSLSASGGHKLCRSTQPDKSRGCTRRPLSHPAWWINAAPGRKEGTYINWMSCPLIAP